ncbi:MAG: type VI secretion system-associated protein TagF [Vicinamibacterales bacterium]
MSPPPFGSQLVEVGFYGKLPSHGDFLRRRVSDTFVSAWDEWLQECMAASRTALGERWLDVYLTSPAWRFACTAGACGIAPLVGLMVPSVDRVGRYFPLTIVSELPSHTNVIEAITATGSFFDRAERLVIDTLAAAYIDFDDFDGDVVNLADDLAALNIPPRVLLDPSAAALTDDARTGWQVPIGSAHSLAQVFEQLLSHRLSATYDPLMVWWTEGSAMVEPSCLIRKGLPHPDTFAALLDGSWEEHRWQSVPAQVEAASTLDASLGEQMAPIRYRSTGSSDVGRARTTNQDSFVERPEIGVWVVADGLGGHSDGETASRMVCDAFADFTHSPTLEDMIEAARARVQEVNEHLLRASARSVLGDRSGSTVVALLARNRQCAVLWAGDSRVYRWRAGRLAQLTRDHNLAESGALPTRADSHIVTRAVGAHSTLALDLHRDLVRPGDRFLLCSDGLTRAVPDERIREWMEAEDIRGSVDGLIRATLDAGAPDNVTVLIAEAYSDPQ